MEEKGKMHILTGGMILITLGVLIILGKTGLYGFAKSWPWLLIVIALGTLIQRVRDVGGWVIGIVGVVFLLKENFDLNMEVVGTYLMPVLLILVGVNVLMRHKKKQGT